MKTLVLSGINLKSGGTLNIYYDILEALIRQKVDEKYHIIAFVSDKTLFSDYAEHVTLEEISVQNHIQRLYYECVYFKKYSKKRKIDIWLSVHDITPNVKAEKIYTYCQTAFPFLENKERYKEFGNVRFMKLYKYVYSINKRKAAAYIVQQEWMRKQMKELLTVKNVIVSNPSVPRNRLEESAESKRIANEVYTFLYPSLARFYKNFEAVGEAVKLLNEEGCRNFKVQFTLDGTENSYAEMLRERYGSLPQIEWIGAMPREELFRVMRASDCLVYTSALETWGLPVMEYKSTGNPMIVAKRPYSYETVGSYDKVKFVDADNYAEMAEAMKRAILGEEVFEAAVLKEPEPPFARNWAELIRMIID